MSSQAKSVVIVMDVGSAPNESVMNYTHSIGSIPALKKLGPASYLNGDEAHLISTKSEGKMIAVYHYGNDTVVLMKAMETVAVYMSHEEVVAWINSREKSNV